MRPNNISLATSEMRDERQSYDENTNRSGTKVPYQYYGRTEPVLMNDLTNRIFIFQMLNDLSFGRGHGRNGLLWLRIVFIIGIILTVICHISLFNSLPKNVEVSYLNPIKSVVENSASSPRISNPAKRVKNVKLHKHEYDDEKEQIVEKKGNVQNFDVSVVNESDHILRSLEEAKNHKIRPLDDISIDQYTMRINTWRRNEQLITSIKHHSQCTNIAKIQIVWCDKENTPPKELLQYPKVVLEYHDVNTLNERFHILSKDTPTMGILSIDDDVLFPCDALNSGFFKWTQAPHRIVGYDARLHVENKSTGKWKVSQVI